MAPDTIADWASAVWLARKTGSGGYVYTHHHWNGPAKVYVYSTPEGTWAKCTMCSALLPVPKWRLGRRLSERVRAALTLTVADPDGSGSAGDAGPTTSGDGTMSVAMTYEELVLLARRLQDQTLETVTGKKFSVRLYRDVPFFTPASSGRGQSDGRKAAEAFVERYNATGSLRPVDYKKVTRNASYYIGLLMAARR